MAPVKFDDLSKVATSILNDDYQVSGYVLKTKQKTSFHGMSVSSQVDLFGDAKCSTPGKLTVAMPKPFGCPWFVLNKLEMDKAGKFKLETTKDDFAKDFKIEVKSDLTALDKVSVTKTYTGVKDAQMKVDYKLTNPRDFTAEATYICKGNATAGVKFNQSILEGALPDVGFRYMSGRLFCSLVATKKLSTYDFTASYKATPEVSVALSGQATQKGGMGNATVGVVCKGLYKAKASLDGTACVSAKYVVAPGLSVLGGVKYSGKGVSCGCQVSIE